MNDFKFPEDFMWGAACSAFQLEGGRFEGGKTDSINEHNFYDPRTMNNYADRIPPDVGADFYHRYPEDIALMKELGIDSFRFSFAWSRICPDVTDKPNQAGIDFYNKVIDTLIENGITPFFDLFHSGLPQWIEENGGIKSPDFVDHFVNYARICFENFGDRVKYWSTVNEPLLTVYGSYANGRFKPYEKSVPYAMEAVTNMIIAHFRSVKILRELWPDAKIGAVHCQSGMYPARPDDEGDVKESIMGSHFMNLLLEPMAIGKYPDILNDEIRGAITDDMVKRIKEEFVPMDFHGANIYSSNFTQSKENTEKYGPFSSGYPRDAYGFTAYPRGLYDRVKFLNDRYPDLDIYITENGYTYKRDVSNLDVSGELHDDKRIEYIKNHIKECENAVKDGLKLKGYYYWSALDCWEGVKGYGFPMGLVAVNFDTKERFKRDSFYYYQKVIKDNCIKE